MVKKCFILATLLIGLCAGCYQTTPVRANLTMSSARVIDKDSYYVSGTKGSSGYTVYYLRVYAGGQVYEVNLDKQTYKNYKEGDTFTALVPRESDLK